MEQVLANLPPVPPTMCGVTDEHESQSPPRSLGLVFGGTNEVSDLDGFSDVNGSIQLASKIAVNERSLKKLL